MARSARRALALLALHALTGQAAHAQDASQVPPRAAEAVNALQSESWRAIEAGLDVLEVSSALGTRLTALRLKDEAFRFAVLQADKAGGITARSGVEQSEAVLAVNGGFFAARSDGKLVPVGMLIDDGQARSQAWKDSGGYLTIDDKGRADILLTAAGPPDDAREAIQSRPVLIEPGGKWAMRTNTLDQERRTLFCRLDDGTSLLLVVSGQGLSLYEAGWILRGPRWGGFFDCDAAIALDGGSSTQLTIDGEWDLRVDPLLPVQNLLTVQRREAQSQ
ncbi:MAG: phosphodiester glycosidase family protein [Nitratireductor sp.]|nr:phosphodiester glycosidase family protein [Nitratireductor sp.]